MKTTSFVAAVTLATLSTFACAAHADDDPSAVAAARTIGIEGLKLAEAGNCKEAIEKLDRAEKLHHAPTTLGKLGECNVQTGHLVLGVEQLRRLARENLAADAPPAFVQAKARAQKLVEETSPRIAQLHVNVAVGAGVTPQVNIDGENIPVALLDLDRPTDPGQHVIEASAPGYKKTAQTVNLKEGERLSINLTPEIDPNAPAPPPPGPPSTAAGAQPPPSTTTIGTDTPPPPANSGTMRIVGWSLLGVGAAGIVTGVVAGALGLGTKSKLDDSCGSARVCDPDQQGRLDRLDTEATIGTIGFVVGGVGLVGGAAILLFGPKGGASSTTKASSPLHGFDVGLGRVGYRGSF